MATKTDVVVVGGGIIGLATALNIVEARKNIHLVLIEKEKSIASHQTGHNSGVIHSGINYKPDSLKALNCKLGYQLMLTFCQKHSIKHDICGKIIVATKPSEIPSLETLYQRGISNGLKGLKFLTDIEIREIEPYCAGIKGLFVPQTGIVDYVEVANKYLELLMRHNVEIVLNEPVVGIRKKNGLIEFAGVSKTWVASSGVVCAGLQSDRLARMSEKKLDIQILPFRGEYYKFSASAPKLVNNLIYPVPDPGLPFLGVHFTRMINGGIECGPNAVFAWGREAYKKTDFNFWDVYESILWPGTRILAHKYWRTALDEYRRSFSKKAFVNSLQKLVPDLKEEYLESAESGIRAQACDKLGNLIDDFDIRRYGNLIHVCNAPSPAATASLAIGKAISNDVIKLIK